MTRTITYRDAMREALRAALAADPRVLLIGEERFPQREPDRLTVGDPHRATSRV